MKYTIAERIVWLSMGQTVFKFLAEAFPAQDASAWKKRGKRRFRELIADLDEIGKISDNPFRAPLSGGSVWLAAYETAPEPMSEALFGEMVIATLKSPLMRGIYARQKPFLLSNQLKRKRKNEKARALSDSDFNWHCELVPGRDQDEYTMIFSRCGLCALGRKLGHPELIPHMCQIDYLSIDLMGGVLFRTKTLAGGDDCCDFYVCKKGSKWQALKEAELASS